MSKLYVTGYWHTAIDDYLKKGKSFKEWVIKEFARQYGALIQLRDSPSGIEIPVFKADTYHLEESKRAEKDLEKLLKFTEEKKLKYGKEKIAERIKDARKGMAEIQKELDLLKSWKSEVESFAKKAMMIPLMEHISENVLTQYNEIFSSNNARYYQKELARYEKMDPMQYWKDAVEVARKDIIYHTEEYKKEVERITERNLWVKNLKELLSHL